MSQSLAVVLIALLVSSHASVARRTPINTGSCRLQTLHHKLNSQHVRFFYWTLPEDMADEWRGYCGSRHMVPWDGILLDSNPLGVHIHRTETAQHSVHEQLMGCHVGELYATNQFSAPALWRQQTLMSPLRVDNVTDADVVVVDLVDEYCMSAGSQVHKNTTFLEEFTQKAMSLLYQHVAKTNKPHLVPMSRPEIWYHGDKNGLHGPELLSTEAAQKLTWLSTELTDAELAGMAKFKRSVADYHVVAEPYPTTLHMSTHDPYFTVLHALHAHADDGLGISASRRRKLLTTPHVTQPCYIARKTLLATSSYDDRFPIRRALTKQCQAAGADRCVHYHTLRHTFFKQLPTITETLSRAWFCLMPHGDTHSRRALVDCLMQDAIPVVFHNFTREPLPYADIINPAEYVVSLQELAPSLHQLGSDDRKRGKNVAVMEEAEDVLGLLEKRYPIEVRIRMVQRIFTIKHMFQSMVDPVHQLIRFDQLETVHCLDDAFTSTFKAALRSMCRRHLLSPQRCSGR